MKQTQVKFIFLPDGTITEEVLGANCDSCAAITQPFEASLGAVTGTIYKPEYYQPCEVPVAQQHESESLIE
tara:strand:+ start:4964 stop:5176 length:213 start_codon:yes stop_codon:yes gene_type:complete